MGSFDLAAAIAVANGCEFTEWRSGLDVVLKVARPIGEGIFVQETAMVSVSAVSILQFDMIRVRLVEQMVRKVHGALVQNLEDYELLRGSGIRPY